VIRHTVAFRLVHPSGSAAEQEFLDAGAALAAIPGVQRFEQLRQTSSKNDFTFGFSMEFADQAAYDGYDGHPVHTAFVAQRWVLEVEDFLELDYQLLG
jgi:quinol monooxygenase YgiN